MLATPLTWFAKIRYTVGAMLLYGISYGFPNRVQFFEPKALPLLTIDKIFPFLPWTIFVYMSEYLLYAVVLFIVRDVGTFRRILMAYLFSFISAMFIFIFFPTKLIFRPEINGDGIVWDLFRWLHWADTTVNCFPSQHVSLVTIPFLIFCRDHKRSAFFFGIWAFLIAFSTLGTKQHYFVDILGGFGLALIAVVFASWWERRDIINKLSPKWQKVLP